MPAPKRCYVRGFLQKLDKLPQYATYSRIQKQNLAMMLTDTREMKKYFHTYLRESDLIVVVRHPPPQAAAEVDIAPSGTTPIEEPTPTLEPTILQDDNREFLEERLSDFSVKLHITFDEDENSIQIALQVGDQLIKWTRDSVIEPHSDIPHQTLLSIDLSRCLMKTLVSRGTRPLKDQNSEVDDCVSKLCRARDCLIDHIVQQITIHNRYYSYKKDCHDSQSFIKSILGAVMIEKLPNLSYALSDYITDLRNGDDVLQDHKELDNYVKEHLEGMSAGMVEYVTLLYYQHHLDSRAKADDAGSETWKCPEDQCQLTTLLLKLNKQV